MEGYVAGWDGGGTKTAMEIRNLDGKVLLNTEVGGLNFNSYTKEEIKITIQTLLTTMSKLPGGLKEYRHLCIAAAGISNPKSISFLENSIESLGLACKITFLGDHEAALYSLFEKNEGMVLISGTGSICYGRNQDGKDFRSGGWGHIIDDEGSGYRIGRDILSAAVKSYDNRIPKSVLYDMVLERLGKNTVESIIEFTYSKTTGKREISSLAPILLDGIKQNDFMAMEICNKSSKDLVNLIPPVARKLDLEGGELGLSGGILNHFPPIRKEVIKRIKLLLPELKIIETKKDHVTGAALFALEMAKKGWNVL